VDDNDVSQKYMVVAQNRASDATISEFMSRIEARDRAKQSESAAPADATAQAATPAQPAPAPSSGVLGKVGAVAADIGKGFTESPTQVVGGMNDAWTNTLGALDSTANWLNENVADLKIPIPKTGSDLVDRFLANPIASMETEKIKAPESTTGNIVRNTARFLTGFIPASRAAAAVGVTGAAGALTAGAVSDFLTQDPSDKNFSNLVQSYPALKNPVNEYLAVNPDDPEALNRLRHSVEGLGFGALTEGVVRGVRYLAHRGQTSATAVAHQEMDDTVREGLKPLGDPEKPLVVVGDKISKAVAATDTGVPAAVTAKGVAKSADNAALAGSDGLTKVSNIGLTGEKAVEPGPDVFINFSKINQPDDVQQVIRDMADAFKGPINAARRGVQSNEDTKALADQMGMTLDDLLKRQSGAPFNAEQSYAARQLLNTSAEKVLEMARKAADPNAGMLDQYNFRKMLAVHQAVQSEVIAARTETARALQAWSIPAGSGGAETARNIDLLMHSSGGSEVTAELARRIATLGSMGVPEGAMASVIRKGWSATSLDMVKEAYVNGLLWSWKTHAVNTASNTAVAFQQIYERAAANKVGDFLGSSVDNRVVDGEALAMMYGYVTSVKDAFRLSGQALRTGQAGAALGKIDLPYDRAISSAAIARERGMNAASAQTFAETPLGRAVDFIGEVNGVPGRLLGAGDEFFKTIGYRGELHAQSLRQATQEGKTGADLFQRMMEIANNPPEHIKMAAADAALYSTFTNKPGEWAQSLMNLRSSGSLNPTFAVMPFVRTPANILRYTFERTPLAPLVGQWRADVAAGGARRDLALARMATGTAILAAGMDMASSGLITGAGPVDPGKKEALMRQGWQPYSVVADGKYYSFNRADPIGTVLGVAGTIAEKMKEKDNSPEDFDEWEEILAASIGTLAQSVVDKTYFTGISNALNMIHGAETGEGGVERYIDRQTGSFMPFSALARSIESAVDPTIREVNSPWDAIQSQIAGLSDRLPPARDLWGKERKPQEVYGRVYDAVSPMAVTQRIESPIDSEISRLGIGLRRIDKKGIFAGSAVLALEAWAAFSFEWFVESRGDFIKGWMGPSLILGFYGRPKTFPQRQL
jgi:hypothetical protein